jgi:hypothetical protein
MDIILAIGLAGIALVWSLWLTFDLRELRKENLELRKQVDKLRGVSFDYGLYGEAGKK